MNKMDLIKAIALAADLTPKQAEEALNAFTETVTTVLTNNSKVTLVGFGSFEVSERAARVGRNPKTGEELKIAASKSPKFKPGKSLKDAVASTTKGNK